ncbi:MAG TPA: hypothetical protein PLK12_02455 [Prolixibacteraceae bacterium]|nr:hypothetical protein [Prolixibacteraceae bacterium]
MKKAVVFMISFFVAQLLFAQLKMPGVNWDEGYSFDTSNKFRVEFFDKNGKLRQALDYEIAYQSAGKNFAILLKTDQPGRNTETILDLKNEVAIQIFGPGTSQPMYNATKFKYPNDSERKMLELLAAPETKTILGKKCQRYTYIYKKINGEVWITTDVDLSNDYGIFRAAKMASLHNTLSVGGFVMEMTSEDATGAKTVMKTVSLFNSEKREVSLKNTEMGTSINKVNYYTF